MPALASGRIRDETLDGAGGERTRPIASIDGAAGILDGHGLARIAVEHGVGIARREVVQIQRSGVRRELGLDRDAERRQLVDERPVAWVRGWSSLAATATALSAFSAACCA